APEGGADLPGLLGEPVSGLGGQISRGEGLVDARAGCLVGDDEVEQRADGLDGDRLAGDWGAGHGVGSVSPVPRPPGPAPQPGQITTNSSQATSGATTTIERPHWSSRVKTRCWRSSGEL